MKLKTLLYSATFLSVTFGASLMAAEVKLEIPPAELISSQVQSPMNTPAPIITGETVEVVAPVITEAPIQAYVETQIAPIATEEEVTFVTDSFYNALTQAYKHNPMLQAERAQTEATKTQLSQARAGYMPSIYANADATHTNTSNKGTSFGISEGSNLSKGLSLNLDQSLYKGGSTLANIRGAKHLIAEQEMRLSSIEQQVIYDATVAYMDLLQHKAFVDLNENNKALLAKQLEQTNNRFRVGELTRTDVSQAEARFANANADVINAHGKLKSAEAKYFEVIGAEPPVDMAYPALRLTLPVSVDNAIQSAQANNRDILMAKYRTEASQESVSGVYGELLPQVSLNGSVSKTYDAQDLLDEQDQTRVGLNASIPLYQSGGARARVKEAKQIASKRLIEVKTAENRVAQEVQTNWQDLKSAEAEIVARQAQVKAASVALEGTQYEAELGERTVLDALDAYQQYLDSQVNLTAAKRNEVVAQFALARSLGVLTPSSLDIRTQN